MYWGRARIVKSLIFDIFVIIFAIFAYSFGKYLINKKVSWIKLTRFILGMISIFILFIILFYFELQELLKLINQASK